MIKKVVIVGGGFAGSYCAQHLEHKFQVTLIDTKDYFEFTPSILRAMVDPAHISQIQVYHHAYLQHTTIVCGTVTAITSHEVIVGKEKYLYDYLIICTGSRYHSLIKSGDVILVGRNKEVSDITAKIKKASSILIVGGGLVGVELAAEIKETFQEKKVTVVHSKSVLLERSSSKAQQIAAQFLQKQGVELLFNERVVSHSRQNYCTYSGKKIKADLAFLCTGILPDSTCVQGHYASCLDERNFLSVNEFLQVKGSSHVFAAGDVTSIFEEKTAQNALEQAKIVVKNIENMERGFPLQEYHSSPRIMVMSLGRKNGIIMYRRWAIAGRIAAFLKRLIEWRTMRGYKSAQNNTS